MALFVEKNMSAANTGQDVFWPKRASFMIGLRTYLRNRCWARKIFQNYPYDCEISFVSNRTAMKLTRWAAVDFQTACQVLKEETAEQDTANEEKADVDLVHFYFELMTKFIRKWKTIYTQRPDTMNCLKTHSKRRIFIALWRNKYACELRKIQTVKLFLIATHSSLESVKEIMCCQ